MSLPPILQTAVLAKSNADKIPELLKKEPVRSDDENENENEEKSAEPVEEPKAVVCEGYDFNKGIDYDALLKSYSSVGLQAMNFGAAVEQVKKMLTWKGVSDEGEEQRTVIFLGYTSNMVSCGIREVIRFLVQHKMVDVIVSSAGGIEEDFIKCMAPTYMGDFELKGSKLREEGINRIGNMLVPNDNYCLFEEWMTPILNQMLKEQNEQGVNWTPSKMIARLGKEINNEKSIYYWAWKNDIPVFNPAITDGSIGDMIFFHSFRNPGLRVDIVEDIVKLNRLAMFAPHTGVVILGGGLIKHHIMNANLMRNGCDYCVYINDACAYDGSDTGATPDEAVSWGKIRAEATPVKIYCESSLVFPLLVAQTFAKEYFADPERWDKKVAYKGK